jgi:signal transduction histidine kinase
MNASDFAADLESVKAEQSLLILLNLAVLAGLVFVHAGFLSLLGPPSALLIILIAVRFLMLVGELLWLQNLKITSHWPVTLYRHLAIWVSIGFAFLASYVANSVGVIEIADRHYWVLMVLPIISAAFYFRLLGALAVTGVTIALTFLQTWLFFQRNPPADVSEYFEAATVGLIFLVVGLLVWFLVTYLRQEQVKLKNNLAELNRTRDRLTREEKLAAVGRLASGIAHEVRNPVAMISSSLTMAMRDTSDWKLRDEMFEVAAQEAARLEKLTSDFLAYARVKAPVRKTVYLHDTLGYIASLGQAMATRANVVIKLDVAQDLHAMIDDSQIQSALLNLVTNALHAMPSGGQLTLGGFMEADNLVIYVENSGDQLTAEIAQRIFEPFFTTKEVGTGLGLSIVHNIAQAHGGDATLAVNERGRVRFVITLPVENAHRLSGAQEQEQWLVFS